jgi:hypothetical protein
MAMSTVPTVGLTRMAASTRRARMPSHPSSLTKFRLAHERRPLALELYKEIGQTPTQFTFTSAGQEPL